mmetsp:Transcript_96896/g.289453  ORF Transcript_96896/g.289453 Transcript_96896/m.289453 type:complete len:240 (-) Transcript_96896:18-737(-)
MESVALFMMCFVSAFSGQCRLTKSLVLRSSSSGTAFGLALRLVMTTFMPMAAARSATLLPMPPLPPIRPSVFPASSKCGTCRHLLKLLWSPFASIRICCTKELLKLRTNVITSWATASLLYAGQLQTVMPFSLAAARSMLLKPVPASWISRTEGGKREMTSPGTGISFVMTTSWSCTRARISSGLGSLSNSVTAACEPSFVKSRPLSKFRRPAFTSTAFAMAPRYPAHVWPSCKEQSPT